MPDGNRPGMMQKKLNDLQKRFDTLTDNQRKEVNKITDELTAQFLR
jgi:hypothetical protein